MSEPESRIGEHVRVSTRHLPGALAPARVTPYCARCGVAWPCPHAAHVLAAGQPEECQQS